MNLFKALPLVCTLCSVGVVAVDSQMFGTSGSIAQEQAMSPLELEIAEIESQIEEIEAQAIAAIPSLLPGSPARLPGLGKILFFDKELSVNRNEACAFCHMPQTGFQGGDPKHQFRRRSTAWIGANALKLA